MNLEQNTNDNYAKAIKHVKEIRGFYTHLLIYILINTTVSIVNMKLHHDVSDFKTFFKAISHVSIYATWLLWGIGLLIHGLKIFWLGSSSFRKWEELKIKKLMDEDRLMENNE